MSDLDLLIRVSRLYFELGETQERVAELVGVTRPQVSRLLKEARQRGVVEIRVIDRGHELDTVAAELRDRFGLRHVEVVSRLAGPDSLTHQLMGRAAAVLLAEVAHEGMIVGVGGGATVNAVVDAMAEASDLQPHEAVTIIPLIGGVRPSFGANDIARRLARAVGSFAQEIPAPGVVDSPSTRAALMKHPAVANVAQLWHQLDVAIFGIGGGPWSSPWIASVSHDGTWPEDAVGEVLTRPFDIQGRLLAPHMTERTIGMTLDALRGVPFSLAIAGGKHKVQPVLGALRAGLVSTLVTDRVTAELVLEHDAETSDDSALEVEQPLSLLAATRHR